MEPDQVQLQHHDHQLLETMDVTAGSLIQAGAGDSFRISLEASQRLCFSQAPKP